MPISKSLNVSGSTRWPAAARYRWPLLLGVLFLAFLLFSSWSIYQAGARVSPVVDPDYYRSGQGYHAEERAWRAAAAAGWQVLLAREGELLQARLLDGDGAPVGGSRVIIRSSRRNGVHDQFWQVTLAESSPGVYQAMVAEVPVNPVELLLSAATEEARLDRRFRVSAGQWRELAL